jgi:AcrR family transcriptional regulator
MVSQATATPRARSRHRRGEGSLLRGELIEAARNLLSTAAREQELSIRGVTRVAGVAPQSFYLQFASLDELLYAVYAVEFGLLREAMEAEVRKVEEPSARLLAACLAYCRHAEGHPSRYRTLTEVRGQAHHAGWEGTDLPGAPTFTLLLDLAAAALKAAGASRDPFLVAASLWASLHGLVTLRASRPAFPWPPLEKMTVSLVEQALKP